jgi:hypothetical protein
VRDRGLALPGVHLPEGPDRVSTTECLIRYLFDAAGHPASIGRATDLALYLALVHIGLQAGSLPRTCPAVGSPKQPGSATPPSLQACTGSRPPG